MFFSSSAQSEQGTSSASFEVGVFLDLRPVLFETAYPSPVIAAVGESRYDLMRSMFLHAVKNSDEVEVYGIDLGESFAPDLRLFTETVSGVATDQLAVEELLKQLVALMYERYAVMDEQCVPFWDDTDVPGRHSTVVFVNVTREFFKGQKAPALLSKLLRLGKSAGITPVLFISSDAGSHLTGELKANISVTAVLGDVEEALYDSLVTSEFAYDDKLAGHDVLFYRNSMNQGTYPFVRNSHTWEELYRWVEQQNGIVEPELFQYLTQE